MEVSEMFETFPQGSFNFLRVSVLRREDSYRIFDFFSGRFIFECFGSSVFGKKALHMTFGLRIVCEQDRRNFNYFGGKEGFCGSFFKRIRLTSGIGFFLSNFFTIALFFPLLGF